VIAHADSIAIAVTQEHMSLQKTIGQAKAEIVPSLIVMSARARRAAS